MNIFLRELKANLKSLLIWSAFIMFFIYMGMAKFSAFAADEEMLKILDGLPQALLDAFQMNVFNLTTVSGYFGVMFTYFALIAAIFAVMLGSDIISKEERDKTVEFSLTLPITRAKLVTGKILAAFVNCILFVLVIWGGSVLLSRSYEPEPSFFEFLKLYIVALFFIEMIFLAIGILLGSAMKQYKRASSVAVSLLLGTYFLSIISDLSENLEFLKYFSPFKYFNPLILLNESRFEPIYLWISLGIVIVSIAGAYLAYSKRDLYI
jgi:ABC-2 type transport system permease protein